MIKVKLIIVCTSLNDCVDKHVFVNLKVRLSIHFTRRCLIDWLLIWLNIQNNGIN